MAVARHVERFVSNDVRRLRDGQLVVPRVHVHEQQVLGGNGVGHRIKYFGRIVRTHDDGAHDVVNGDVKRGWKRLGRVFGAYLSTSLTPVRLQMSVRSVSQVNDIIGDNPTLMCRS